MISVIMSTYREKPEILKRSVESVLIQDYTDFEFIILLDDPDNLENEELLKRFADSDQRIRLYRNERNLGMAASYNKGFGLAKGCYIAIMDADDLSLPERLGKQLGYLEENRLDLVGCCMKVVDEEDRFVYTIDRLPEDPNVVRNCIGIAHCVPNPTFFGRRELFTSVLYRNIRINNIVVAVDYDFLARASLQGYRIGNMQETLYVYRRSSKSLSRENLLIQFLEMKYISGKYRKGRIAEIEGIQAAVERKWSRKAAEQFAEGDKMFYEALAYLSERRPINAAFKLLRIMTCAPAYIDRIVRFVRLWMHCL